MERLSPEQAIEILKKEGVNVTKDQASNILDFLYNLSHIVVAQYLRKSQIAQNTNIPNQNADDNLSSS